MYCDDFERAFVETAVNEYYPTLSHARFARMVFGDSETSLGKWQKIRTINSTLGKPQSLTLSDAVAVAMALNKDFASFAFQVQERMKIKKRL